MPDTTHGRHNIDYGRAMATQAEEEIKEGMAQLLTRADICMKMNHCAEGSQGQESFHVWLDDLEFDGIELTNSGAS